MARSNNFPSVVRLAVLMNEELKRLEPEERLEVIRIVYGESDCLEMVTVDNLPRFCRSCGRVLQEDELCYCERDE